jgi:uncharacterized damage-inducible protein DinB
LERIPTEQFGWKPHERSTAIGRLATHVAEIPTHITTILTTDERDMAAPRPAPTVADDNKSVLDIHDKNVAAAVTALENATDEDLHKHWTFRNGEHIVFSMPRIAAVRTMALSHSYHHRGQLSVYLRLLGISVPSVYGPSADEQS